jgi:superfamily I DNA/RNA helicase
MIPNSKLLLGPPGCGKTYRLIQEIKAALQAGTHPSRIGVISFTRKAIEEMIARSCAEFNLQAKDFPYMKTSHAFGFHGLGLKTTDVMSPEDYNSIGREIGLTFEGRDFTSLDGGITLPTIGGSGARYLQLDSRARLRMIDIEQEYNEEADWNLFFAKLKQLSAQLVEYKAATDKYDFVDMIEQYVNHGEVPSLDYLFIDEAQDFTPLQWEMAKKIAASADNVWIAGDDDQAIHRWTGVDVSLFNKSSDNIEVLSQSYRIPKAVHRVANMISKRISGRHEKIFTSRDEEGCVQYANYLSEIPLNEGSFTLMARTNGYVSEMANFLRSSGFKFTRNGRSSISEELVANLMTWDALCQDKSVGVAQIKALYSGVRKQGKDAVVRRGSMQLLDALASDDMLDMDTLIKDYGLLRDASTSSFDALNVARSERDYIAAIFRRGEDLLSVPRIKVSTFHAMKGGEDDNCVVWTASTKSCETSKFPDDEHRAFYVGVTRTRHNLYILQSDNKYRYSL